MIVGQRGRASDGAPFAEQERVADNFGLLFDAIAAQGKAGCECIFIPAKRVTPQDQVNPRLLLPDMRHFVDKQALVIDTAFAEIAAIEIAFGVKPDVAIGRHRHTTRLEKSPFAIVDANRCVIDGIAKD